MPVACDQSPLSTADLGNQWFRALYGGGISSSEMTVRTGSSGEEGKFRSIIRKNFYWVTSPQNYTHQWEVFLPDKWKSALGIVLNHPSLMNKPSGSFLQCHLYHYQEKTELIWIVLTPCDEHTLLRPELMRWVLQVCFLGFKFHNESTILPVRGWCFSRRN